MRGSYVRCTRVAHDRRERPAYQRPVDTTQSPREANDRAELLADLDRYRPADAREGAMVANLRAFVAQCAGAFERTLAVGHVTASAWVVDRTGTFALLTHHRKLDRWLQLGGHADGDADLRRVALREAREESGLHSLIAATQAIYDVDIHAIPGRGDEAAHLHYDVRFAFFADPREAPRPTAESYAVAWIALADLERYGVDDSVRRLVRKTPALLGSVRP